MLRFTRETLRFTRETLANHGLDLREIPGGFEVVARDIMPSEAADALREVTGNLGLDPLDQDKAIEYVAGLTMWAAMRHATDRAAAMPPPRQGKGKRA